MNTSTNEVVRDIRMASEWLLNWFQNNSMESNPDKFHILRNHTDSQEWSNTMRTLKTFFIKNY